MSDSSAILVVGGSLDGTLAKRKLHGLRSTTGERWSRRAYVCRPFALTIWVELFVPDNDASERWGNRAYAEAVLGMGEVVDRPPPAGWRRQQTASRKG